MSARHRHACLLAALVALALAAPNVLAQATPSAEGDAALDDAPRVRRQLVPADATDLSAPPPPVPLVPSVLFDDAAHLPLLAWPEARFQKRFGLWELDVRGSSAATTGNTPWLRGVPASSASASLTWRYHGLLRGVVRPVVGVAAFASQATLPPHWSLRNDALWSAGVAPNAGVEVVTHGVGVGWRVALPMGLYQTTPDGFYHPQLMGKRQPDWGTFFQGMIQNMYLIWEKDGSE